MACLDLGQGLEAGEIAGVADLVEVEHLGIALGRQEPHHGPTDEAGAAGHQDAAAIGQEGGYVGRGGFRHGWKRTHVPSC